jgi:hypothetical protein
MPSTRTAALLLIAVAAIDGAIATWLEGDLRRPATVGADGVIHLALTPLVRTTAAAATVTTVAAATIRGFALRAAFRATRRSIVQAPTGIKFLLTSCEDKILPTITTTKSLVLKHKTTNLSVDTRRHLL